MRVAERSSLWPELATDGMCEKGTAAPSCWALRGKTTLPCYAPLRDVTPQVESHSGLMSPRSVAAVVRRLISEAARRDGKGKAA